MRLYVTAQQNLVVSVHCDLCFATLSSAEAPYGKFLNNSGRAGNDGKRERAVASDNVSKMAPDFRGRLVLATFLINIYKAEHAVVQEGELLSLSMRPFQQAKQSGRTICFKCFEEDGVVNFFLEGAGLSQHFRTMHRINAVFDS